MMKDQLSQKILSIIADKIQSHPEVQDHHQYVFPAEQGNQNYKKI